MVPVVSFIGYHNSGKTTFATKVVKVLKERGCRIAVLKSTKHRKVVEDTRGKDSYRYRESGADAVGIVTPDEFILFENIEEIDLNFFSFLLFDDYDLVLCEGFKHQDIPKIEVTRRELGDRFLFREIDGVIAVVSDYPIPEVKTFPIDSPEEVAQFLEEEFIAKRTDGFPEDVELFVNGKRIPMKYFVRRVLRNVLSGFIESLGGVDGEISRIDVRIKR